MRMPMTMQPIGDCKSSQTFELTDVIARACEASATNLPSKCLNSHCFHFHQASLSNPASHLGSMPTLCSYCDWVSSEVIHCQVCSHSWCWSALVSVSSRSSYFGAHRHPRLKSWNCWHLHLLLSCCNMDYHTSPPLSRPQSSHIFQALVPSMRFINKVMLDYVTIGKVKSIWLKSKVETNLVLNKD